MGRKPTIHCGDCLWALDDLAAGEVDLIVTSPPYAERRKSTYGGIPEAEYVDWFCERADQFEHVLSLKGSFVLNIKEHCVDGERSDYIMRLVLALRERGWRLVDEFIWHKPNPMPGSWRGRLKDGWEHIFHFAQTKDFNFYPDEVRQPMGDWIEAELKSKRKETGRQPSATASGFGADRKKFADKVRTRVDKATDSGFGFDYKRFAASGVATALPSNVLTVSNKTHKKDHPATFPPEIPEFFIKLMTKPGDLVLDPFMGSGTTLEVAERLGRRSIGVDVSEEYCAMARERLANRGVE